MKKLVCLFAAGSFCFWTAGSPALAETNVEARSIDFRNDLIPLFTKHGCNAGACHGAAVGRGGFKLSLYGGNPGADYAAIVRQASGRRVNLARPERSLILLKPAEHVEHGGGTLFDLDSDSAKLLTTWIRQGAEDVSRRTLTRVEITPQRHIFPRVNEAVPLGATAHYSDGSSRDVTRWTVFTPEDTSAVKVTDGTDSAPTKAAQSALVLRKGRHLVVARYFDQVVPLELLVPLSDIEVDLSRQPRTNFIDEQILKTLTVLRLPPSPTIDNRAFLRRVTLDLTGRLPTAEKVAAFADASVDERRELIDELLSSTEFTEYWTLQLAKLLRIRPQAEDATGAATYHAWLSDQIQTDGSYRELARRLLLASGDSHRNGPANFYRTVGGPRNQAEFMSELFMASRLRCANCHNHPLDRWTQDDYHGLAAIFAKMEVGRVIKEKSVGKTIHPRTLEPATPKIPGEQTSSDAVGRRELAEWLTHESNPYFSKAIVNRLWKRMMGRGLVEPVDDFRDTNPATHPILLDTLARDFVDHGYRIRHTLRVIAGSSTYARSADALPLNKDDDRFYSRALRRPLEPEVLADAISDLLGVATRYGEQPLGTRAVTLVNPQIRSPALDVLGRCGREESCENTAGSVGGLSQKLHLLNGALLNARLTAEGSRLKQLLDAKLPPAEIIDRLYVLAYARYPTEVESKHWSSMIKGADDKAAFLEDFLWGLVSSREFMTNH